MLSLTPWLARLNALGGPVVQFATDVEAAQNDTENPSRVIVLGRETVTHHDMSSGATHLVKPEVLLITGMPRSNLSQGDTDDELMLLREPMLHSLINWLPDDCDSAIKWQRGQILALKSQALFWVDVFTTEYRW